MRHPVNSVLRFGSDYLILPPGCWDKTPKEIKEGSSWVTVSEVSILDQLDPLMGTCRAAKQLTSWQPGSRGTKSEPELMGFLPWFLRTSGLPMLPPTEGSLL